MASWYRRFIPKFSEIIAPISNLITKVTKKVVWNDEAEKAFKNLKTALVTAPILSAPNFEKEFTVQTDASDIGIAGILTQKDENNNEYVVAYFSKKLTKAEQKYTVTEM